LNRYNCHVKGKCILYTYNIVNNTTFGINLNLILTILYYCSVMETIRNVIHAHRNYWECFKYNILLNDNSPEIHYNFSSKKIETYQTRNNYPEIDTTYFDKILNNIIKGKQ